MASEDRASLRLPFDPGELTHVLCRPADLARLLGVSRQAVSAWIRDGKVIQRADGLIDPVRAVRQLLATSDPGRLRAAVLRPLTRDAEVLRAHVATLRERITALTAQVEERDWLLARHTEDMERFEALIAREFINSGNVETQPEALELVSVLRKKAKDEAKQWMSALDDASLPGDLEQLTKGIDELYEASLAGGFLARAGEEPQGEGAP